MSESTFSPFSDHLDRDDALKTLQSVTKDADDGELYLERSRSESLSFDDGTLKKPVTMRPKGTACALCWVK